MNKRKKKIADEIDEIEEMGQESEERSKKAVVEHVEREQKKEKEKEAIQLEILDKQKGKIQTYKEQLLRFFHNMLLECSFPKTYQWGVWYDGVGIRLAIIDKKGGYHTRAFKPVHDPKYDLNACYQFTVWAIGVVDKLENKKEVWTPKNLN